MFPESLVIIKSRKPRDRGERTDPEKLNQKPSHQVREYGDVRAYSEKFSVKEGMPFFTE
jgi:hypothetical protein